MDGVGTNDIMVVSLTKWWTQNEFQNNKKLDEYFWKLRKKPMDFIGFLVQNPFFGGVRFLTAMAITFPEDIWKFVHSQQQEKKQEFGHLRIPPMKPCYINGCFWFP